MTADPLKALNLPKGINRPTRAQLRDLTETWPQLLHYPHTRMLLRELAEAHDLAERCRARVRAEGEMVEGRWGQTPHPMLKVEERARAHVTKIITTLNLKTREDRGDANARRDRARTAHGRRR